MAKLDEVEALAKGGSARVQAFLDPRRSDEFDADRPWMRAAAATGSGVPCPRLVSS